MSKLHTPKWLQVFFVYNFKENYKQIIPSYRPGFDEYFLSICNVLKERSGCLKEAVGSIIVKDKRIIATGYNGTFFYLAL